MQSTVTIRDYPCGSGKTTLMIEGFRSDRTYLVIVPLLTEVDRVIEWSKSVPFQQPHANDNVALTKTEHLENMVLQGQNIVAPTASSSVLCLSLDRGFSATTTSSSTRSLRW